MPNSANSTFKHDLQTTLQNPKYKMISRYESYDWECIKKHIKCLKRNTEFRSLILKE